MPGCEIRCPNELFVGDFYRARTDTVKVGADRGKNAVLTG
jgi:hypothetical protein